MERFQGQILRIESNKNGLIHTSSTAQKQRTNAYGRIRIKAKWDGTCAAVKLGKVCGAEIRKGQSCYYEPVSRTIECRECWS